MGTTLSNTSTVGLNLKYTDFLTEWLILLLCFGYPIQAMIPVILKVESTPINLSFRVVYLCISLYLIIHRKIRHIKITMFVFILFWLIYSYRIINDISFKGKVFLNTDSFYVYSFAFGMCLIPTICVFINTKFINTQRLIKNLFWVLLIANICIITNLLLFSNEGILSLFLTRAYANVEINGETIQIINPITIGQYGELLSLISIFFLLFEHKITVTIPKYIFLISLFIGIINLILGASRGPLLFFALLLFYIILIFLKYKNLSIKFWSKSLFYIFIFFSFFSFFIKSYLSDIDFEIINRLNVSLESTQEAQKEDRDYIWASAWKQFTNNPIFGDSFVSDYEESTMKGHTYAHNLLLDVLMSTGIIGTTLIIILLVSTYKSYLKFNKDQKIQIFPLWIALLGYFFLSLTSGGVFMSYNVWIMIALICSIPKYANN